MISDPKYSFLVHKKIFFVVTSKVSIFHQILPTYTCWVRVIYDVMLCVVCWGVVCSPHWHQVRGETGEMLMMVITAVGGDTLYSTVQYSTGGW